MSESNSHSQQHEVQEEDEYSPELSNIPQTGNHSQNPIENLNNYIRISGREEKIDEQGILSEFNNRKSDEQRRNARNSIAIKIKRKIQKLPQAPSKKYDFGYIKKKWKAEIDINIQKYKQYLKQQKQSYDFKQKEFMLDFFKILLDGIFQLKDYAQSQFNDLTNNQRKIIQKQSDEFIWLRDIVNSFDKEFKEAKYNQKIESTADKWNPLIKNCRDESNFQLRRKIIRLKIKPVHVIVNKNEFLMSEQARLQAERLKKLILAEADKNFKKPIEQQEESGEIIDEMEQTMDNNNLPDQLQSIRSISVNENLERRIGQEMEKLNQYKEFLEEREMMLKQRIDQLLKGTSSYQRIMDNFVQNFYSSQQANCSSQKNN